MASVESLVSALGLDMDLVVEEVVGDNTEEIDLELVITNVLNICVNLYSGLIYYGGQ